MLVVCLCRLYQFSVRLTGSTRRFRASHRTRTGVLSHTTIQSSATMEECKFRTPANAMHDGSSFTYQLRYSQLLLRSFDCCSTWRAGQPAGYINADHRFGIAGCLDVASPNSLGIQCGDEFQVAETADGTVVGLSRHPGGPALTFSSSGGETWEGNFTFTDSILTPRSDSFSNRTL